MTGCIGRRVRPSSPTRVASCANSRTKHKAVPLSNLGNLAGGGADSAARPRAAKTRGNSGLCIEKDETRNYDETDRELLLRPEVEVIFGRHVRQCWPTARLGRFLQPEAATRAGGLTAERLAAVVCV